MLRTSTQHTVEKRVYKFRLDWAWRISENLYGIIANRWCVFRAVLQLVPRSIKSLVMAALVLHNNLRKSLLVTAQGFLDTESRSGEVTQGHIRIIPASCLSQLLDTMQQIMQNWRDIFKVYFVNEVLLNGSVTWFEYIWKYNPAFGFEQKAVWVCGSVWGTLT